MSETSFGEELRRLAADDLRQRGHHDRVAKLSADTRDFFKHVGEFFQFAEILELKPEIGNHATGDLMQRMQGIVFQRLADRQLFLLSDGGKVIAHRFDRIFI